MKFRSKLFLLVCFFLTVSAIQLYFPPTSGAQEPSGVQEILFLNNRGVAYLDQYRFKEAAEDFRKIISLSPDVLPAHVNLGIAYFYDQKYEEAVDSLKRALSLESDEIHSHYVLGLIYRNQDQVDQAIESFLAVHAQDPLDPSTNYYLGQLQMSQRNYEDAANYFREVIQVEPYNASAHYNLAQALTRSGQREAGREEMDEFRRLQELFGSTTVGLQYLEQGEYAIAIDKIDREYLPGEPPAEAAPITVTFSEIAAESGIDFLHSGPGKTDLRVQSGAHFRNEIVPYVGSGVAFGDYDRDGWMDLYLANSGPDGARGALFRNRGESGFEDVTRKAGVVFQGKTTQCLWGDYNNDGYADLYLINYGANRLYRNEKDGTFTDVTRETNTGNPQFGIGGTFVDYDHDGDLDLFITNFADEPGTGELVGSRFPEGFGGAGNVLYRNNGDETFSNVSQESKLAAVQAQTVTALSSDFDNSRDVDFLLINLQASNLLMSNLRDGSFLPASDKTLEIRREGVGIAVGDLDQDEFVDLVVPSLSGGKSAILFNRGNHVYESHDLSSLVGGSEASFLNSQVFDYDNDGDLDILLTAVDFLGKRGLSREHNFYLLRNEDGTFDDVSHETGLDKISGKAIRGISVADYDNDGDLDFVASVNGSQPLLFRNDGGNQNNWVTLSLVGTNSNRSGIGTKAELKAGRLWQKLEALGGHGFLSQSPSTLHFGLGKHKKADIVRILWPNGVVQSEVEPPANQTVEIQELDRKGTSCPILYVWNGETYKFQTDFLGGSAYGSQVAPGVFNYPDTDEYIKLNRDDVVLRDGKLFITMNNQLEEAIFFDQLELAVIDHPGEYEVFPDEKLLPGPPYQDFRIFSVESPSSPVSAVDGEGRDILPAIREIDRIYPKVPETLPFKGYSDSHEVILDLGNIDDEYALLVFHAWIDYADSTSNLAAAQAGFELIPPYLQVLDQEGNWKTVVERMGFPAGLPKPMTVDLSGKFLSDSRKVRIVTNMKIYWDQIIVETGAFREDYREHRIQAVQADLRYKGFPEFASPDGRMPKVYTYDNPSYPEWKVHVGAYTRFGDVLPLLERTDDMYVITRSGDEIEAAFDIGTLPALPEGWARDYLIYVDGFGKDMDPNSAAPHFLGPLPFHGMSSFPYPEGESYPQTPEHRDYLERWNTRFYGDAMPVLPSAPPPTEE